MLSLRPYASHQVAYDGKLEKYVTPCYLSTHLCVQLSHVAIPNLGRYTFSLIFYLYRCINNTLPLGSYKVYSRRRKLIRLPALSHH